MGDIRRRGAALLAALLAAPLALTVGAAPAAADGSASAAAACTAGTGPHQKEAERFLGLPVDGRQSRTDCEAIRAFQEEHLITPSAGFAGPVTRGVMDLMNRQRAAGATPDEDGRCPADKGRIACVDLTRQLSWIQDGRKLVYGPVPVRTGSDGYETRTGLKRISWRNIDHVSTLYDVPMPYSQFFDGGQAFHSVRVSVWSPPGSHGCVNMMPGDAEKYWNLLRTGDEVYVWGRKPGT
ncbi:L,D-transpeptidase [Streptomyces chilikensis]|uniref:L,D-transpeptidase n=1 Tax=Streptomyces chilikensis TaxID=1194079 RepID=UPI0014099F30|nr:L,D-transpeptidase [Streptomyces chilikensis]